jgi:hypothetical protein
MKHIKTFNEQIFENDSSATLMPGDEVMILYKLPGAEERELVPVKIIKREQGSNSYSVSFAVEGNPYASHHDMSVQGSKIIGPYQAIKSPVSPSLQSNQPVPTDYNKAGDMGSGGISNDYSLPNS